MTKTQFRKETKGMMNQVRTVNGITIAFVGWLNDGWRIVPDGTTFDEASRREYKPIAEYHTREELITAIFN